MKRQNQKSTDEPAKQGERILFFDILRILCVAIIVYDHSRFYLVPWFNSFFFADGYGPFNIYSSGLQGYAVYGMILVSGAVLEYNYQGLEKLYGYSRFLFKRFLRLYPAFWMSLIATLLLFPFLLQKGFVEIVGEFSGFFFLLNKPGGADINPMGWFIGTIFLLYILYPFFSRIVRKYGLGAVIGFWILSWGLRFLLVTYNLVPLDSFYRWFPLCNAFEFCLGIYLVQISLFPKKENTSPVIRTLADISFYAFLFHFLVFKVFLVYLLQPLLAADAVLAMNNSVLRDTLFYLEMMGSVIIVSWVVMLLDDRIRIWILQQDRVKKFLAS
jgi:peptidoglycan/LPS O-acetylase OafA/YrhL